jgi:hypothetical protein
MCGYVDNILTFKNSNIEIFRCNRKDEVKKYNCLQKNRHKGSTSLIIVQGDSKINNFNLFTFKKWILNRFGHHKLSVWLI